MKLKELFTDANKWTQHEMCRDINGKAVGLRNKRAVSFSLLGGVEKYYLQSKSQRGLFEEVIPKIKSYTKSNIVNWNDDPRRTFEDVRKLVNDLDI